MANDRRRILVQSIPQDRLDRAKWAFTTRRVPHDAPRTLIAGTVRPRSGDLVLARLHRFGQHSKLERPDGRRTSLHVGDEIAVVYADRYAPDQFEAEVPHTLGPTNLVASGGVAAKMLSRSRDVRRATDILPIGLLGDERGRPINIGDYAMQPPPFLPPRPRTVAVLGTSMNSGKTTTVRYLVHCLSRAGLKPAATKVTGTGSGNDYWVMIDAGAHQMLDFTDVGLGSTYLRPMHRVEKAFQDLVDLSTASGSDVNLIEVADGIYQRETAALIDSTVFHENVDLVLFAAADAMGAAAGVSHLLERGHKVVAVSGKLTRAPLAVREAQGVLGLPILTGEEFADPQLIQRLLELEPESRPEPFIPAQSAWPVTVAGLAPPEEFPEDAESETFLDEYFTWSDDIDAEAFEPFQTADTAVEQA